MLVGPGVPDFHTCGLERPDVGVALEEPQQFVDDAFQVQASGGQQGEAVLKVVALLRAAHRQGAGAVVFDLPVVEDVPQQVEVLVHGFTVREGVIRD